MKKRNRKGHITRTRNRYAKEVAKACLLNRKCYVVLKVTDGPGHAEIQEDWWEQTVDCRSAMAVSFNIMGIEGNPFMRSERHGCIVTDDAIFSNDGTLHRPFIIPERAPSTDSYLWHFGGGIVFPGEMIPRSKRAVFCEYNSQTHKGFIIVTFDGRDLLSLYRHAPQLLRDVRSLRADEYDWLQNNW